MYKKKKTNRKKNTQAIAMYCIRSKKEIVQCFKGEGHALLLCRDAIAHNLKRSCGGRPEENPRLRGGRERCRVDGIVERDVIEHNTWKSMQTLT